MTSFSRKRGWGWKKKEEKAIFKIRVKVLNTPLATVYSATCMALRKGIETCFVCFYWTLKLKTTQKL